MPIQWRDRARRDLRDILTYLRDRAPVAATRVQNAIERSISVLEEHPERGRGGRDPRSRELIVSGTPYIVAYSINRRRRLISILRILHGARRWPQRMG